MPDVTPRAWLGLSRRRRVICAVVDVEAIEIRLARGHGRCLVLGAAQAALLVLICSEMTVPVFVPALPACRPPLAYCSSLQICAKNKLRAGKLVTSDCAGFCAALVRVPFRFFRFFRRGKMSVLSAKHRCLLLAGELGFDHPNLRSL